MDASDKDGNKELESNLDDLVEENFELRDPGRSILSGLILKGNAFTAIGHEQGPNKYF